MQQRIANVMLVVDDYDRAIAFFTAALGFSVLEDVPMGNGKRWVRVGPAGASGAGLVLGKAGGTTAGSRHTAPDSPKSLAMSLMGRSLSSKTSTATSGT
jgi:catechol 2,3-dioxygenase-like lactoylglutathione lyase family enzyme